MITKKLFIDGAWVDGSEGKTFKSINCSLKFKSILALSGAPRNGFIKYALLNFTYPFK